MESAPIPDQKGMGMTNKRIEPSINLIGIGWEMMRSKPKESLSLGALE